VVTPKDTVAMSGVAGTLASPVTVIVPSANAGSAADRESGTARTAETTKNENARMGKPPFGCYSTGVTPQAKPQPMPEGEFQ
jgi:hypothetical protein